MSENDPHILAVGRRQTDWFDLAEWALAIAFVYLALTPGAAETVEGWVRDRMRRWRFRLEVYRTIAEINRLPE